MAIDLPPDPVPPACVWQSAEKYGINPVIIAAIIHVEGGKPGRIHWNRNGTYDIGPMQINSIWIPRLRHYGVTYRAIKNDPCANVDAGSWILANQLRETHGDLWKAVGRYHSPHKREAWRYISQVWNTVRKLLGSTR